MFIQYFGPHGTALEGLEEMVMVDSEIFYVVSNEC